MITMIILTAVLTLLALIGLIALLWQVYRIIQILNRIEFILQGSNSVAMEILNTLRHPDTKGIQRLKIFPVPENKH